MVTLRHGIVIASIPNRDLIGFYFTPVDDRTKCLFLDPVSGPSTLYLDEILTSGAFSAIAYRELLSDDDIIRFKLALVNMQSIPADIGSGTVYINYVTQAVGQNPAERSSQCTGICSTHPVPNIPSYDPFGPLTKYNRNIPTITIQDRLKLERWSQSSPMVRSSHTTQSVTTATIPLDTVIQHFLSRMIDNGMAAGDPNPIPIPRSYLVPVDHPTKSIQTRWGLNLYHGACWEIGMWLLQDSRSTLLDSIRLSRKTTQFGSIIGNNINSPQAYQYLSQDRTHLIYPRDPIGLAFGTISNYHNFDPSTLQPIKWSSSSVKWTPVGPSLLENAWFLGLAPMIRHHSMCPGFKSILPHLIDVSGGFYSSPLSDDHPSWTIRTVDNAVMYAVLKMASYQDVKYLDKYFTSVADLENGLFFSGKNFHNKQWILHTGGIDDQSTPFSVGFDTVNMPPKSQQAYMIDVRAHMWIVCSLQPELIDRLFNKPNATLDMWDTLKQTCGRFDIDGRLQGFGFNNLKDNRTISSEITFSAMLACKVIKAYYGLNADASPHAVSLDLADMEGYMYNPVNSLLVVSDAEAYFNAVTEEVETGWGEHVYPFPSSVATAWHIFYVKSFNPFSNGRLLR